MLVGEPYKQAQDTSDPVTLGNKLDSGSWERLGKEEGAIEAAKNLLKYGDPIEKISIITGLPLEKVQQLEEEINQTK